MTTPRIGADAPDVDLYVNQHETFRARFTYKVGGVAHPLDGYSARLSIARRKGSAPIVTVTSEDGGITLEPLDDNDQPLVGTIDVVLAAAQTALLKRNAVYDLLLIDNDTGGDPETDRLFEGAVVVNAGVTALA